MKPLPSITALTSIICSLNCFAAAAIARSPQDLYLAYPPPDRQTTAKQIFFIGSAPPQGQVFINDKLIERSNAGNFAPSFPLEIGPNNFTIRYGEREIEVTVTRISTEPTIPDGAAFAENSFTPARNIARLPNESICFGAIARPRATVSVRLAGQTIPLLPQTDTVDLPSNLAIYTAENLESSLKTGLYRGCTKITRSGNYGNPLFLLRQDDRVFTQTSPAAVTILDPLELETVEITAPAGVTRTGPSTNYSRLTPLPKGTRSAVTGKEGEWLRLEYGPWIKASETRLLASKIPPRSIIRSISSKQLANSTEIIFPLQTPVPLSVEQGDKIFSLTLYNTIPQTDIIRLDDNPYIKRLDWQQLSDDRVKYTFSLKSEQQWGYSLKYRGRNLILALHHPPQTLASVSRRLPLDGIKILLDPGHGGAEFGAIGPTGYPEKAVNLTVSKLLQAELVRRGAIVYMTREEDEFVSLQDRVKLIEEIKPAIALSIHYNALPDSGDAVNTKGVGMFWYHPMAGDLAVFLHNYLVRDLDRPSYGVFWNNLALTRPHSAPAVLLELGFTINPQEFEWISDPQQQKILARSLADAVTAWFAERQLASQADKK